MAAAAYAADGEAAPGRPGLALVLRVGAAHMLARACCLYACGAPDPCGTVERRNVLSACIIIGRECARGAVVCPA